MTVDIKGYAFNLGGVAVDGASAEVFAKNGGAKVGDTVETGSGSLDDGEFEFSGVAEGTYDIKVTSGTNVRWRKYDDEIQLAIVEAGSLRLRGTNAAYTHVFQGTPTATRTITFPDATGTVALSGGTGDIAVNDDVDFSLGSASTGDALLRWTSGDASNHALAFGLGDTSQQLHITDKAAIATDWARSAGTHPEVAIHSNTTPATDYLAIGNHDGTTAYIDVVGGTTLSLKVAGTVEATLTGSTLDLQDNAIVTTGVITAGGFTIGAAVVDAAELEILDGASVTTGELNYLDLGATAVGNAIASKAVVLDSDKDYTGIRNLTATTFVGALTGNASGTAATVTGAAQSAIESLGTLTTLTVDNVIVNGTTIGHTSDTDLLTLTSANLAVAGDLEVSGSVEVATIDYTDGDPAITIADGGGVTFAQSLTVTGATVLNGAVTLGNHIDDIITINGSIAGTNAVIFEGNSTDGSETTLAVVDPDADRTIYMPNQDGYLGVFAAASTTQISSTPEELNLLDGVTGLVQADFTKLAAVTSSADELNLLDGVSGLVQADLTKLAALDATAAELDLADGNSTIGTTAVSDGHGIVMNHGGTMAQTTVQTLAAYLDDEITAMPNLVTVDTIGTGVWQGTPIATAYIADNSITLDKLASGTDGNIISYDTSGNPVAVATGNDGQVLTSAGADAVPTFEDLPAGSAPSGAQTAITTILNAGAKLGRDSQNLIDFATTDNKIILRVNDVDEVELVENALSPVTSNGVSLGTSSLMWSDAFLATGSVLNFNNGNMTVTHSDTVLTVAGGTLATGEIKVAAQQKIYLDGGSHTYIVEESANQLEIYSGQNSFSQFRMTASRLTINANTGNFDFSVSGDTIDNVLLVDASADALFLNGDVTLASHKYLKLSENSSIKFTDQIGVDNGIDNDDGQGIIFTFRAGATVTPFSPVYIDGNNEVQEADADAIATMPCIGVTTNTSDVSADADIEVMMLGLIRHDSFADFGAAGAPVYVSAGASGVLTTTAPSGTDDVVQVVGHAIAEDLIFVQPCLTTIEHA